MSHTMTKRSASIPLALATMLTRQLLLVLPLVLILMMVAVMCPPLTLAQHSKAAPLERSTARATPLSFLDFRAVNRVAATATNTANDNHSDEVHYAYNYQIDHAPSSVHLSHEEQRDGAHVSGHYGLLEPSGAVRSVRYEVLGPSGGFRVSVQTRTAASRTLQRLHLAERQQPTAPLRHATPVALIRRR